MSVNLGVRPAFGALTRRRVSVRARRRRAARSSWAARSTRRPAYLSDHGAQVAVAPCPLHCLGLDLAAGRRVEPALGMVVDELLSHLLLAPQPSVRASAGQGQRALLAPG